MNEEYYLNMSGTNLYWNGKGFAIGPVALTWGECTDVQMRLKRFATGNIATEILSPHEYRERIMQEERIKEIRRQLGGYRKEEKENEEVDD